jgi:hypothetical protein
MGLRKAQVVGREGHESFITASPVVSGYLLKRTSRAVGNSWQKRWFVAAGHYLKVYKDEGAERRQKINGTFDLNHLLKASASTVRTKQLKVATRGSARGRSSVEAITQQTAWAIYMKWRAPNSSEILVTELRTLGSEYPSDWMDVLQRQRQTKMQSVVRPASESKGKERGVFSFTLDDVEEKDGEEEQAKHRLAEKELVEARGAPPVFTAKSNLTNDDAERDAMFFKKLQNGVITHEEYELLVKKNDRFVGARGLAAKKLQQPVQQPVQQGGQQGGNGGVDCKGGQLGSEGVDGGADAGVGASACVQTPLAPLTDRLAEILAAKLQDGTITREEYDIVTAQTIAAPLIDGNDAGGNGGNGGNGGIDSNDDTSRRGGSTASTSGREKSWLETPPMSEGEEEEGAEEEEEEEEEGVVLQWDKESEVGEGQHGGGWEGRLEQNSDGEIDSAWQYEEQDEWQEGDEQGERQQQRDDELDRREQHQNGLLALVNGLDGDPPVANGGGWNPFSEQHTCEPAAPQPMSLNPEFKRFALMHSHAKLPPAAIRFQMAKAGHSEAVIDELYLHLAQ